MANWTAEVFENEYLPADATDVHAIVTVTCKGAGTAGQSGGAAEVIVVDTSGSMSSPHTKITAARKAAAAADRRDRRRHLVRGRRGQPPGARVVYPPAGGMAQADRSRPAREAKEAVRHLDPSAAPRSASWLRAADRAVRDRSRPRSATRSCSPTARTRSEDPRELHDAVSRRDRRVPVRLPRRRRRLGRQRAARHRVGAARHRSTSSPSPRRWPQTSSR